MKRMRNFVLPLAALLLALLFLPQAAHAQVENCPTEPSLTSIADGEVFTGSNCVLNAIGDIDSFTFSANAGDTYQIALAMTGAADSNVCMELYGPGNTVIYPQTCTSSSFGQDVSVVVDQALTVTGTYQLNVTESSNTTQGYALSLERLFPFPPNATQITTFGQAYNGDIAEPTQSNAFIFSGVTTGTYEVTAAMTGTATSNVCMTVYAPNGSLVAPSSGTNPGCTASSFGQDASVVIDFTPTTAGTYMEFIQASGNASTQTYSLEVSCLVGNCGQTKTPPCTLKDAASYASGTLTMNFTVGNIAAVTWNAWLTSQNTITALSGFPISQPITNPPVPITKTVTVAPSGTVGVLTTLTYPTKGIVCSTYTQVNTGTP
ncbi:MAG TPA: hypothetical protein VMD99_09605 [Terriglobales bacterium]|nr:hypothetical protein [Terriglobales bacterium]